MNTGILHYRQSLYHLNHQGSPTVQHREVYSISCNEYEKVNILYISFLNTNILTNYGIEGTNMEGLSCSLSKSCPTLQHYGL